MKNWNISYWDKQFYVGQDVSSSVELSLDGEFIGWEKRRGTILALFECEYISNLALVYFSDYGIITCLVDQLSPCDS